MAAYVFIGMIVLADEEGFVRFDEKALGRRIGLPEGEGSYPAWEDFRQALKILESDDPRSNLPNHNGKRIIPIGEICEHRENRGWWIVNYKHYRDKGNTDERNEYKRGYMAALRKFNENNDVKNVNKCEKELPKVTNVKHTDTDTDTDTLTTLSEAKASDSVKSQSIKTKKVKTPPLDKMGGDSPPLKSLVRYFADAYTSSTGGKYVIMWARDMKGMKQLIESGLNEKEIQGLIHKFLDPAYKYKGSCSVPSFVNSVNSLQQVKKTNDPLRIEI